MSEESPKKAPSESDDPPDVDMLEHLWARTACRIATIAAGACMASGCSGGASFVIALPLAGLALWLGIRAFNGASPHSGTRAYAKMAIVISALSLGFSAAWVIAVGAWTAMFFALIVLAN